MIKDMTEGSPSKIILKFAMPMLLSMLFQQLYNVVDSIVAGKFIGVDALASVGASYPITMLFIAIATGASVGCCIVISQLFGAKRLAKMKSAISTAIISLVSLSIILMLIGVIICNSLMRLIDTPADIFATSALYLRVYIFGIGFLFLYNTATAVFTGLGDSQTPLYFLIFSSLLNIALDLLFVIKFKMGVSGVAWATFIAQGISSILAISYLMIRVKKIEVEEEYQKFDPVILKRMGKVAIPSIMQQSFISVGQLCVQGLINSYGPDVIAGYSSAFKVNTFAVTSMGTISNALSSFTAQNIGARKLDRVKQGYKAAMAVAAVFCAIIVTCFLVFGREVIGFFVDTATGKNVIDVGLQFLLIVTPCYPIVMLKVVSDGVLRGAGDMGEFMVTTFTDLLLRVIFSYILSRFIGFTGICWAFPIGWVIGTALSVYYYFNGNWKRII